MRKILLSGVLACTVAVVNPVVAQTFKPIEQAQGFNAFVRNNLTAKGGDTHGPVAMGNNLILDGSTIFSMNTSGTYPTGTLNNGNNYGMVIGNQVNFTSGNQTQLNQGFLRIGNTTGTTIWYRDNNNNLTNLKLTGASGDFSSNPSVLLQRQQAEGTATDPNGLNFTAAFGAFASTATKINSWNTSNSVFLNKIVIPNENNPKITLADNKINYINLTAAELSNLNNLGSVTFNNSPTLSRPVVFNIQAAGVYNWSVPNFASVNESDGDFIIWNFYGTTTLNLNGSNNIYGSVFSPNADIVKNNPNNLNGQVVGQSLVIVTGEIHYHPFITDRPDIPSNSTLGVKGINLSANLNNNTAQLHWTVFEEINILSYDLERSLDGTAFTAIGNVASRGNNASADYSYPDNIGALSQPVIYYRVKAKENNGSVYYSRIVSVRRAGSVKAMQVWPNPVTDQVVISYSSPVDQKVSLQLFDIRGAIARTANYSFSKGTNQVTIHGLDALQAGVYTIRLMDQDQQVLAVQQVIK